MAHRTQENSLPTGLLGFVLVCFLLFVFCVFCFVFRLLVYNLKIQLRNSQKEEMHRARYGGRDAELPCPLWDPSQNLCESPNPETL